MAIEIISSHIEGNRFREKETGFQVSDVDRSSNSQNDCDCACPDNDFYVDIRSGSRANSLLQQPSNLHRQVLSPTHTLLFNPLRNAGVALLNDDAMILWNEYSHPHSIHFANHNHKLSSAVNQMVSLGLLEPIEANIRAIQGRPRTLSVWLHVTNECNLRCDYCYIKKSADVMSTEVGFAAVDAIVRSALKGGFQSIKLKFSGGEATLNLKLVLTLHKYAFSQFEEVGLGLDTVILSNGVAIGEREIEAFQKNGIRVTISLDGLGEAHNSQRRFANGKGSFAWVDRSLDRLLTSGIKPFITITVSDRNLDGLSDVVQYVLDKDLPFNLNFYRENDCSSLFVDLKAQDDRLISALHRAFDVIEAKLPQRSLLDSLVDRAQFSRSHNKPCGVGESYMVIDHHGNIAKCHMEIERSVTTIHAENPLEIIKLDQIGVQNIRVEEKEGCRNCEWKYWCAGGCPLLTYRATGRYDIQSPYCRVYKAIYPRLLRLEGLRLLKHYQQPEIRVDWQKTL
jgi:uncharacterized protein